MSNLISSVNASDPKKDDQELKLINEEIYRRNLELAEVNKTLSLLKRLYQITLLNLNVFDLAREISETVRVGLNMENVGILLFDHHTNKLKSLSFSRSDRFESLLKGNSKLAVGYETDDVSRSFVLQKTLLEGKACLKGRLEDLWGGILTEQELGSIISNSHIRGVLFLPLVVSSKVIGLLVLCLNREYEVLSSFEKESINSLTDVVSVALDRTLLYEQLKSANNDLKALDQARSDFITIASHQLRTPPTTLKWYLSAIKSGDYGEVKGELKETILKTEAVNNSLIALIDDLLNASRIERGKMEFVFAPTDIYQLVKITFEQLVPLAGIKNLKLVFNPPPILPPLVMADGEKVRQVINNFIDNAIKYTSKGQVEVFLESDDKEVKVRVQDTGKGFSPDAVKKLFEKYTRGQDAAVHSTGLGLGLYVAKVVVGQHNGRVWAESPGEGRGAVFGFALPVHNNLPEHQSLNLVQAPTLEASGG